MTAQVMFYGNLQKAQTILGCVQACITTCARDVSKCGSGSRVVLDRYIAELEEIECDLVSLIDAARAHPDTRGDRDGPGSNGSPDSTIL